MQNNQHVDVKQTIVLLKFNTN